MVKRRRLSSRVSRKKFRKAAGVHPRNKIRMSSMRGGIRM